MNQNDQFNQNDATKSTSRKNNSIIYWVIIAILLAGCVYLFMSKNQMAEQNAAASAMEKQRFDSLSTEQSSLKADFEAASAKIDQLTSQNAKLDSMLRGDKEAMAKLQAQIRAILGKNKATKAELDEARLMISTLNDKSREYEARIAELERENTILTGKNKVLTRERDSTVTQNIAIKQLASVLHASNISIEALKIKRNGKEKETSKAKKADVLRVSFDIDENRIAESGAKTLYLRIIGPDGQVIASPANGSGMMTTSKGDHLSFTIQKSINLVTNQPVNGVTADWKNSGDYARGIYRIEIFHDGYNIGAGEATLK